MYVCMYVCMDGWMDGWMDGCLGRRWEPVFYRTTPIVAFAA